MIDTAAGTSITKGFCFPSVSASSLSNNSTVWETAVFILVHAHTKQYNRQTRVCAQEAPKSEAFDTTNLQRKKFLSRKELAIIASGSSGVVAHIPVSPTCMRIIVRSKNSRRVQHLLHTFCCTYCAFDTVVQ